MAFFEVRLTADTASLANGAQAVCAFVNDQLDGRCLIDALKSGHLGGVALDVYEDAEGIFFEDLSGQVLQDDELARLLTFPSVIITSHQAFLIREALADIARTTVANLEALSTGAPYVENSLLT